MPRPGFVLDVDRSTPPMLFWHGERFSLERLPADRSPAGLDGWRQAIRLAAEQPNIAIKISGIGVKGEAWTVEANRPIVLDTIDAFGPDRCLFASNFPVDSLVVDFDTLFNGFKTITRGFSASDRAKMFHDNAARIYRLG